MLLLGTRAILEIVSSTSLTPITFFLFDLGIRFCAAAVSSITSIALSGSFLSLIYFWDSSAAAFMEELEYLML